MLKFQIATKFWLIAKKGDSLYHSPPPQLPYFDFSFKFGLISATSSLLKILTLEI